MKFAQWVFRISGIYGVAVLVPFYFLEDKIGLAQPPAITHPEYFYGFLGVGLAWQIAFLIIAMDPLKYRLLMIPSIFEKFSYACAVFTLFANHRLAGPVALTGCLDFLMGLLFLGAFYRLINSSNR